MALKYLYKMSLEEFQEIVTNLFLFVTRRGLGLMIGLMVQLFAELPVDTIITVQGGARHKSLSL